MKKNTGIVIAENKTYLVESRLLPVARKLGLENISALVIVLKNKGQESLLQSVLDAMTTNETFFFRDIKPFDCLRDRILPSLFERRNGNKSLRIWCAAASTGQEPYSIAMLLNEEAKKIQDLKFSITGTDISDESLKRAKDGIYSQFEVQRGLPAPLLIKYFHKKDNFWSVNPDLSEMVKFSQFNLLDNFFGLGKFDVVFCRNVLIYFDLETKADILTRIRRQMPDDGILVLGGAETVINVTDQFKPIPGNQGFYTINPAAA